jgi:hypothetical protein
VQLAATAVRANLVSFMSVSPLEDSGGPQSRPSIIASEA